MLIERWDGMPPADAEPGKVWWHSTVQAERQLPDGSKYLSPSGALFQAPPNATQDELRRAAFAKWAEIEASRMGGVKK